MAPRHEVDLVGRAAPPDTLYLLHAHDLGSGLRLLARSRGGLWNHVPARRLAFRCPAGVRHRRYWRLISRRPDAPLACSHTSALALDPSATRTLDAAAALKLHRAS